jgi:hypothetical protein
MKNLVKIVLTEINKTYGTDYQLSDVYFDFTREVMTNASDNALIEKTNAETQQIRLTSILNSASQFDSDTILKAICELFELNYEEVKLKAPVKTEVDLNQASEQLANVPVEGVNDE